MDARALARENNLSYEEIGGGAIHSAKLSGGGHEILIFADMRNVVVDGESALVGRPIQWNGSSLMLSQEAADLIRSKIGAATRAAARTTPFEVILDPGHGGKDPGALSASGIKEKDVNLEVALRLGKILEARGVNVTYTRRTDVLPSLDERAALVNRLKPDLFVSIHTNADERRDLRGSMTLYPDDGLMARALAAASQASPQWLGAGGPVDRGALLPAVSAALEGNRIRGIRAAREIQNALAPVTGRFYRDNGIIEDFRELRVLKNAQVPAVLVEIDFLSNTRSAQRLATSSYRASVAGALSRGIMDFLENASK